MEATAKKSSLGKSLSQTLPKQTLPILPEIKSRKSEKYVETYAFIDPGSTATFCTEDI